MTRKPLSISRFTLLFVCFVGFPTAVLGQAFTPLPVEDDPLVRVPGTQPHQVTLAGPNQCFNCHDDFDPVTEPGSNWRGSMMAQAARDFIFWSCMAVAAQDSIWALDRPNATDLCERCHFPEGWLEGRSDPTNASLMTDSDYDGVHCVVCHQMYDPFFETTYQGVREGDDWVHYWDETELSGTPSQAAADVTYAEDQSQAATVSLFNGNDFFVNGEPFSSTFTENAAGQFFVSGDNQKRASFADANANHQMLYSRYHKSKFFCATCHDVSNPALANLAFEGTLPGDGETVLPSEEDAAYSYFHVERTFSEFMLSDYGLPGGAPGLGPYAPGVFDTSLPGNLIARCQDCHMPDVEGKAANKASAVDRPSESTEHPHSGVPQHDLTGGNAFVPYVLASTVMGSPNYDAINDQLLNDRESELTIDLDEGQGLDAASLLNAVDRAKKNLQKAGAITDTHYNFVTGKLTFRVQNQTGHKLISGFPEGRRMFVNVRVYSSAGLIHEVNPYDDGVGTLKGLPHSANSPPLLASEVYEDALVYEVHPSSSLTGEEHTFHFVLATGRSKDNRIPPKGFRIEEAATRMIEPVWQGEIDPDYFTMEEYSGGYDEVALDLPRFASRVEINLYYQTTSREYMEFLRDEINGSVQTLPPTAYVIQTEAFFDGLRAWGDTLWQLWEHNKDVPGAAPILMTRAQVRTPTLQKTWNLDN